MFDEEFVPIKAKEFFESTAFAPLLTIFINGLGEQNGVDLASMLRAKYDIYDFAYDNNDDIVENIKGVFAVNKDYYKEMLTNYKKEFDFATGIKRTTTNVGENKELIVELPNKVVNPDNYFDYPSNANKDNSSLTVEMTDPSKFIYLKNQYLRQVRNLIEEFSEKFKVLFMNSYR